MKRLCCFFLVIGFFTCSRPVRLANTQHNVTALFNDSTWFGTATPAKIYESEDKRCKGQRFMLLVRTDIPYKGGPPPKEPGKITGCVNNDCWMMQALNFENIPLKKGKYNLRRLATCGTLTDFYYWQTYPGDGTFRAYTFKSNSPNWVRIRRIDAAAKQIEGEFATTLTDTSKQVMRFRSGFFRVNFKHE